MAGINAAADPVQLLARRIVILPAAAEHPFGALEQFAALAKRRAQLPVRFPQPCNAWFPSSGRHGVLKRRGGPWIEPPPS